MRTYIFVYQNELYHHGIKGQRWGVRNGPTKQILGITGPLTVAAATSLYVRNKDKVDAFVSKQLFNVMLKIKR